MEVVGQRIKELRKTANLKQQDLSEGIVTRSYISQIEKGMVQPSYDTLLKLAERLNCEVEDFYEEPKSQTFLLTETKRGIKYAEGQVESGQFDLARKTLINLRMNEDNELSSYDFLSWVKGKSRLNEAEEAYEQALKHFNILGDIEMKQNVYPKALEYYHEAKAIYKKHGFTEEEKEVIAKIADTHVMLHDYENAASYYYQATK